MSEKEFNHLRDQLTRKEHELDLIMAIDAIRDTSQDPSAMLSALVNLVADEFEASLSMLVLIDRDTGEIELRAVNDRGKRFGQIKSETLRGLSRRAIKSDAVEVWEGAEVRRALGLPDDERVQMAVAPIVMGERVRLGALLLVRLERGFTGDEVERLKIIESQFDSAVMQAYDYYELELRNKELETIYRVDRIRDQDLPFDEMLNAVLEEIRSVIRAEMGFIMLYNRAGDKLELRAVSHDDLFRVAGYYDVVDRVANDALRRAHLVFENQMEGAINAVMCIPLILRDEILGVFGVADSQGGRFEDRERRLLTAIASQMDTAIFESLEQRRLRRVLGRSVDPRVMEHMLANPDVDFLKTERQFLTVLFADIRGSTNLAERTGPDALVGFINAYLGRMTEVIFKHSGTLDKFVGDEVMALFGAPVSQPDHALRAVRTGFAMQRAHRQIVAEWRQRGVDTAPIGVGIASGEMIVGELGSAQRTDYTVIGRTANLGSRICAAAKPEQVLINEATYQLVKEHVEVQPIPDNAFKGVKEPVTVYHVLRLLD